MTMPKVATCCYCGTRAALVLGGKGRHELSCASCGAPLHDLKQMPSHGEAKAQKTKSRYGGHDGKEMPKKSGKKARKKQKPKRLLSELWDLIEDVID